MVSFPPRSHRMYHHLLQLAAIVTALMLICLQLSAGQHGRHNPPGTGAGPDPNSPVFNPP
ncbi:hypothetical protein PVAP13_3KG412200 [Panicum virgatum]|uniref:Uncharacterized protein n=1 Tax=Panicum virgatum TaxID=38727 RepID=A0A8T0V6J8_PANVG|nr:hypothetical protein PVAP13_3KG412200 [Panicum virgatum]